MRIIRFSTSESDRSPVHHTFGGAGGKADGNPVILSVTVVLLPPFLAALLVILRTLALLSALGVGGNVVVDADPVFCLDRPLAANQGVQSGGFNASEFGDGGQ